VRLDQVAARGVADVPVRRLAGEVTYVVRQQRLREILVVEYLLAGQFEDLAARGVHDLARHGDQRVAV
jgi:hypothetical protein